jgi:hypothetical protein
MRKLVALSIVVSLAIAGWELTRARAATGTADSVALYNRNLKTGDHVTVYLTQPEANSILMGTLSGYDGSSLEIAGEDNTYCMGPRGFSLDVRKVLWVVPAANVRYVQKIVSEELTPTTRP